MNDTLSELKWTLASGGTVRKTVTISDGSKRALVDGKRPVDDASVKAVCGIEQRVGVA